MAFEKIHIYIYTTTRDLKVVTFIDDPVGCYKHVAGLLA